HGNKVPEGQHCNVKLEQYEKDSGPCHPPLDVTRVRTLLQDCIFRGWTRRHPTAPSTFPTAEASADMSDFFRRRGEDTTEDDTVEMSKPPRAVVAASASDRRREERILQQVA